MHTLHELCEHASLKKHLSIWPVFPDCRQATKGFPSLSSQPWDYQSGYYCYTQRDTHVHFSTLVHVNEDGSFSRTCTARFKNAPSKVSFLHHTCVCARLHVKKCICVLVNGCVYTNTCMCVFPYVCTCATVRVCVHVYTNVHICVWAMCMCVCECVCVQ